MWDVILWLGRKCNLSGVWGKIRTNYKRRILFRGKGYKGYKSKREVKITKKVGMVIKGG